MRLRLPELRLILLAVAMLTLLAVSALAPASVPRNGVAHAQTADPPTDTEPTSAGICGRTPQVRDAILSRLSDVSQCADVTGDHLASIDGRLHLEEKDITSLSTTAAQTLTRYSWPRSITGFGFAHLRAKPVRHSWTLRFSIPPNPLGGHVRL